MRGIVVLVEVGKLPRQTRKPKKLWLWWNGEGETDLDLIWRAYCRRFDLEHTIRVMKQTLGWTAPPGSGTPSSGLGWCSSPTRS